MRYHWFFKISELKETVFSNRLLIKFDNISILINACFMFIYVSKALTILQKSMYLQLRLYRLSNQSKLSNGVFLYLFDLIV